MARADWLGDALADRGIAPCIPARKGRTLPVPHDPVLCRQRHRIETMFGRLKDWPSPAGLNRWRSLARHRNPAHDRCADRFLSACALAALVLFWL